MGRISKSPSVHAEICKSFTSVFTLQNANIMPIFKYEFLFRIALLFHATIEHDKSFNTSFYN